MEKIKSKKAGTATKLFLTAAMGLVPVVATIGCSDDNNDDTPQVQLPYYHWFVEGTIDIDFYKGAGVSDTQMETAIANVKGAYSGLGSGQQEDFGSKIDNINVNATNGLGKNGRTMTMGHNEVGVDIFNHMKGIANGDIVKAKQKNDIMLAKELEYENYLKRTVILPQLRQIEAEKVRV